MGGNRNRISAKKRNLQLPLQLLPRLPDPVEQLAQRRADMAWQMAELDMGELDVIEITLRVLRERRQEPGA